MKIVEMLDPLVSCYKELLNDLVLGIIRGVRTNHLGHIPHHSAAVACARCHHRHNNLLPLRRPTHYLLVQRLKLHHKEGVSILLREIPREGGGAVITQDLVIVLENRIYFERLQVHEFLDISFIILVVLFNVASLMIKECPMLRIFSH